MFSGIHSELEAHIHMMSKRKDIGDQVVKGDPVLDDEDEDDEVSTNFSMRRSHC